MQTCNVLGKNAGRKNGCPDHSSPFLSLSGVGRTRERGDKCPVPVGEQSVSSNGDCSAEGTCISAWRRKQIDTEDCFGIVYFGARLVGADAVAVAC